jgi:hypothetical protein
MSDNSGNAASGHFVDAHESGNQYQFCLFFNPKPDSGNSEPGPGRNNRCCRVRKPVSHFAYDART